MATADDMIRQAYSRLVIRASETALQPDEIQDGLDVLNDMIAEWERLYHLGASPVANVSDEVRIPRYADNTFKDHLALRLGPHFGKAIPADLRDNATTSLNNMLAANVFIGSVDLPDTLPTGSGNQCDDFDDRRFFPQKKKRNY